MKTTIALLYMITSLFTQDISKLWREYERAQKADKPQDQIEILDEIKEQALKERSHWDYYISCRYRVEVGANINWKNTAKLEKAFEQEIKDYNEPIVSFFHSSDSAERKEILIHNKAKLESENNIRFYYEDPIIIWGDYKKFLIPYIANDYEYALWSLRDFDLLEEYFGERYPQAAFVDYFKIGSHKEEKEELEAIRQKYSGKAMALIAEMDLLDIEFSQLKKDNASSEQFRSFHQKAKDLNQAIKGYSGEDKNILKDLSADSIINTLEHKSISAEIENGVLSVYFKNLSETNVQISSDSQNILNQDIINPIKSFFTQDTVSIRLPEFEDGSYSVRLKSGAINIKRSYEKHSLSIASKTDSKGPAIYVSDYISGEPVKNFTLQLRDSKGEIIAQEDISTAGVFHYLSSSMCSLIKNSRWSCRLSAQYIDSKGKTRSSEYISVRINEPSEQKTQLTYNIISDKGAYSPGETIYYKAILYYSGVDNRIIEEGENIDVCLYNPDNVLIAEQHLSTNKYSSVHGSFHITNGSKGGSYSIRVSHNGKTIGSRMVRVDEFVLPSFELLWEEPEQIYFGGDNACIKGSLKSYSGHSLAGSKLRLKVSSGALTIASEDIMIDENSSFEYSFSLPETRYYESYLVEAIATDLSGETLIFNTRIQVLGEIRLDCNFTNADKGRVKIEESYNNIPIISNDALEFSIALGYGREDLTHPNIRYDYEIISSDGTCSQGTLVSGDNSIDIRALSSGHHKLVVSAITHAADGKEYRNTSSIDFIKIIPEQELPEMGVECFFREPSENGLDIQIASNSEALWAVASLYGDGNILLDSKLVHIAKGDRHLKTITFEPQAHYPESLSISVFYFKNGESFDYRKDITIEKKSRSIPLNFLRFHELTQPQGEYSFLMQSVPGVECAVSVFDASSETIRGNNWFSIKHNTHPINHISYSTLCGHDHYHSEGEILYETIAMGYGYRTNTAAVMEDRMMLKGASEEDSAVNYRTEFNTTLLWAPSLHSDDQGLIEFKLHTGDKVGRFIVNLLAHDKQLNSTTMRQEITVRVPVEVSIAQPQYLFVGDRYIARMSASNSLDEAVSGRMEITFADASGKIIASSSKTVSIAAHGRIEHNCEIIVPQLKGAGYAGMRAGKADQISVTASFIASDSSNCSDAVKVGIPIYLQAQKVKESHSALLLAGADQEALISELRTRFVNLPAASAKMQEISIRQMLQDAIPERLSASSDDALSLSDVLYAEQLLMRIPGARPGALSDDQRAEVMKKLLACRNDDGAWAWFEGMNSSPLITAALLEQWADMQLPDELAELVPAAVQYLDKMQFGSSEKNRWRAMLSTAEYLHIRSQYSDVPLDKKELDRSKLTSFKKSARKYLGLRGKKTIAHGDIFEKVRKMETIISLRSADWKLLSSLGITLPSRLENKLNKELASLLQYAVVHPSGGSYYPNAVMPFRGLLDSELYAHTQICVLLDKLGENSLAEQIRLWIMVQKETQQWESDPAYLTALAQVLKGSEATLESKVVVLNAEGELPFEQIKPAGNGYKLEVEYYRDHQLLKEGDMLQAGNKITAVYKIWSEENRSFVKLTAPRPASFRPVNQISGSYPLGGARLYGIAESNNNPGEANAVLASISIGLIGYREVRAERSEFYFDSYPEEHTIVSEDFVVSQDGVFHAAALEIQSLYAPHYKSIAPWAL